MSDHDVASTLRLLHAVPAPQPDLDDVVRRARRRTARSRTAALVAGVTLVLALAIPLVPLASLGGRPKPAVEDVPTASVVATVPVPFAETVAAAGGTAWVASPTGACEGKISRIDADSDSLESMAVDGASVSDIAVGGGGLWLETGSCGGRGSTLLQLDHERLEILQRVFLPGVRTADIAVDEDGVWASGSKGAPWTGQILHVDTATGTVDAELAVDGDPRDIFVGEGAVWVLNITRPGTSPSTTGIEILHVDSQRVSLVGSIGNAWTLGVEGGSVWVSGPDGLRRIDPRTDEPVGEALRGAFLGFAGDHGTVGSFVVGDGGVWFRSDQLPGNVREVRRLDATTLTVQAGVAFEGDPGMFDAAIDTSTGAFWVVTYGTPIGDVSKNVVVRIEIE